MAKHDATKRGHGTRGRPAGTLAGALAALAALSGCCSPPDLVAYEARPGPGATPPPPVEVPAEVGRGLPPPATRASFRNVDVRFDEDLVLAVRSLDGELRANDGGAVVLDEPGSFEVVLSDALASMGGIGLTALVRRYVFGYEGAPIRDLEIRPEDGLLHQVGVLHKVIDIPFEMQASVHVTGDGWIRIHPETLEICDLSGLGLMHAVGLHLEDLVDLEGAPAGVRVDGDDLFLDPLAVLPPPHIRGLLRSASVEGSALVLGFGPPTDGTPPASTGARPTMPSPDAPNYMYFWNGVLRFGKLFMPDVDMQVVDESPGDPLDFFLEAYNRQLVAGYTRNRPDYGLEVHLVDWGKLGSGGG